jgi:hypothetical protein
MVASPKKRKRLSQPGAVRHPWKENPHSNTQRPPFEEGNEKALHHGAMSERHLAPLAAELEREIVELAPWCARPAFKSAVSAWARAEAQCQLYAAWFAERGLWDERGEPLPGLVRMDRAEARAAALRARLSLDPSALASLITKLAVAQSAGGAQAREEMAALQREARQLDLEIQAATERKELRDGTGSE